MIPDFSCHFTIQVKLDQYISPYQDRNRDRFSTGHTGPEGSGTKEGELLSKNAGRRMAEEMFIEWPDRQRHWIMANIGIPDDQQDPIFESFSQVLSAEHAQYKGSGPGLAISRLRTFKPS